MTCPSQFGPRPCSSVLAMIANEMSVLQKRSQKLHKRLKRLLVRSCKVLGLERCATFGAPGLTTRSDRTLLGAPAIATRRILTTISCCVVDRLSRLSTWCLGLPVAAK